MLEIQNTNGQVSNMRVIKIRFESEEKMIEFGKKLGYKKFTKESVRRTNKIVYEKQNVNLESFFG